MMNMAKTSVAVRGSKIPLVICLIAIDSTHQEWELLSQIYPEVTMVLQDHYFMEMSIDQVTAVTVCIIAWTMLGKMRGPPSQLKQVCVGTQGRVNISWDPLPWHLQNGADISGYIIQYTHLPAGQSENISTTINIRQCQHLLGPSSLSPSEWS